MWKPGLHLLQDSFHCCSFLAQIMVTSSWSWFPPQSAGRICAFRSMAAFTHTWRYRVAPSCVSNCQRPGLLLRSTSIACPGPVPADSNPNVALVPVLFVYAMATELHITRSHKVSSKDVAVLLCFLCQGWSMIVACLAPDTSSTTRAFDDTQVPCYIA